MFEKVEVEPRSLESYRGIAPDEQLDELRQLAGSLQGASVLHVNATAFGGGVAEMLGTIVPLMRDVGLQAEWQVIEGAPEFYGVTKKFHNALQGMDLTISQEELETYVSCNEHNAKLFDEEYDFVVMHDPQPAAVRKLMLEDGRGEFGCWIWRCHIDITDAQPAAWRFIRPYLEAHDAAVFTMREYVKPDLEVDEIALIAPAIDPLSVKNRDMPPAEVRAVLEENGLDPDRPLIAQISRFDPWKDPLGVVDVFRLVRQQVPGLQLVMLATMASDDPEGQGWYELTREHAGDDRDIHLITSEEDNSVQVNAFQRGADVVLQKSKREGFGLVVAEALWKETPVVAGRVGGIPMQLRDGQDGYLVGSTEEAAEKVAKLLLAPELQAQMGRNAREHIRSDFLITRKVLDYLKLFNRLSGKAG
ncbi:MAG: glycosyltransferase [Chloroflexota bacterium]|nr:glycosyltransferase [Chloroflexota bacterium]